MLESILLTGAAGKLGRRMRAPLAAICNRLIATDIIPIDPVAANESFVLCDLTDTAAVATLMKNVDGVVHFGGYPREAPWETIIPANILTTTNLWEAALSAGARRIVYASTNHVIGFHPVTRCIGTTAEIKCDSRYGVSKAFAEILARFYYEKFDLPSLGIRIGRCDDRPFDERMMSTWIHPEDLAQLITLGLTRPVRADVVYGISANSRAWCENPRDFPYKPAHHADDYPQVDGTAGSWRYQGGPFADHEYVGDPERAATYYRDGSAGP